MSDAAPRSPARQPRHIWRWAVLAAVVVVALVLVALVAGRDLIAERLAQDWLAARRVPAGFQVRSLSLTGLSAKVRLGPPADPDLTVERLEVSYALTGPWAGQRLGVVTRSVRLWRPHLKARFADGRLHLGSLDILMQELARAPPSAAPPPDIAVEAGVLDLTTPAGPLRIEGDGAASRGAIVSANARIAPYDLAVAGGRITGEGGTLRASQRGSRLTATAAPGPLAMRVGVADVRLGPGQVTANLPAVRHGALSGPAQVTIAAKGVSGVVAGASVQNGAVQATFDGALAADGAGQRVAGRLWLAGGAGPIAGAGVASRAAALRLQFARVLAAFGPQRADIALDGQGSMEAHDLRAGDGALRTAAGSIGFHGAWSGASISQWRGALALKGALSGSGGLDRAAASRLAAPMIQATGEPSYGRALARALEAFRLSAPVWSAEVSDRGAHIALPAPLTLQSASGAWVAIAGEAALDPSGAAGQGEAVLSGGGLPALSVDLTRWSASSSSAAADVALKGRLDVQFAKDAQVAARGRAAFAGKRLRFDLADCASITAARLAFDPNPVTAFAGRLCPAGAPLFEAGREGWRAAGRLEAVSGTALSFGADVRDASGDFHAAGGERGLSSATLTLARARVEDQTQPLRFRPLNTSGRLGLVGGAWVGRLELATAAGRPVALLNLRHDPASGVGRADIDARALAFAPGGLQPGELTPMAQVARNASGAAGFSGFFAWGPSGALRSGGELTAHDLRFTSPAGDVIGLDTHVRFASLAPLVSDEDQSIAVREVQAITPLKGLTAVFDFNANGASLDTASAGYAGGKLSLEAMRVPFAPGSTYKGAIVLDHVDLGHIIAASNLAERVKVQAVVNARIPFQAGPGGISIAGGELASVGPGRISIARAALGAAPAGTASATAPNIAQDMAYQAMEDLAFDHLDASVNSIPGDRLSMVFHVKGRHDPPKPQRATIAVSDLLAGKALAKPIPLPSGTEINLTLDSTLNFGELVRALEQTWRESLGREGVGRENASPAPAASHSAPVQGDPASIAARR